MFWRFRCWQEECEVTRDGTVATTARLRRDLGPDLASSPPYAQMLAAMTSGYHHDHDEELGMYWYGATSRVALAAASAPRRPIEPQRRRPRDDTYWDETWRLVLDYFDLKAGRNVSEVVEEGFIPWLLRSPAQLTYFAEGDDMRRAECVDWYLKIVR